jgi:hypothetical protein
MLERKTPRNEAATRLLGSLLIVGLAGIAAITGQGCGGDETGPDGGSGTGSVNVTSTPSGAAIYLDGNSTGQVTDATLTGLAPGNHAIEVAKECHAPTPATLDVSVIEDQTAQAAFTLDTLTNTGSVAVTSTPDEAEIYVDGENTGKTTPATLTCVAAGSRTITVEIRGYAAAPESAVVNVTVGGQVDAAFDLSIVPQSRVVLVDHFSNTSCDPCKIPEENLEAIRTQHGSDVFVSIGSHLHFPSPVDPFYLENAAQFLERGQSPLISYLPVIRVDSDSLVAAEYNDFTTFKGLIEAASAAAPAYDVIVRTAVAGDSLIVFGTVRKSAATAGDEVLTVAAIEKDIHFNAENGLTRFDDIVRRFLPSVSGEPLSLTVGEEHDYRYALGIGGTWAKANLQAVAWVRSPSTRDVYQAGGSE